MGAVDRLLIVSAKLVGKALRSEPATKAFEGIGKGISTIYKGTKELSNEACGKINERLYFHELIKAYPIILKLLSNYDRYWKIEITEEEVEKLLNIGDRERYVYHVQLKYLILMYASIHISQKYFDKLMILKNKIETIYSEEELKFLLCVKNDDNFIETLYNQLKVSREVMIEEIHAFEKKYKTKCDFD